MFPFCKLLLLMELLLDFENEELEDVDDNDELIDDGSILLKIKIGLLRGKKLKFLILNLFGNFYLR